MTRHKRRWRRSKLRSLYVWHRYVGISAALLVLLLAATGLILNHSDDWQLDQRHVQAPWLLDWYGIRAPKDVASFAVGAQRLSQLGSRLYLDQQQVAEATAPLAGAVRSQDMIVAALADTVILLTPDGEVIERLGPAHGTPAGIRRLGLGPAGQIVAQTQGQVLINNADMEQWRPASDVANPDIQWSLGSALPDALRHQLEQQFRGQGLPWERVLLDVHSGRIIGSWGPWIMDAAAILMFFLALSGIVLWLKGLLRQRRQRRGQGT